ncbi:MAG: hypothetical protein DRO67_09690 [Candidatus Asgardarchaeum californiense]|nr:MAG: hypothetical protein DRO67_09690 [Candidatus Asgardarchaeum californiense]
MNNQILILWLVVLVFGPKVNLALELDRDIYFPGDVIRARLHAVSNKSFDMEELRIEFNCVSTLTYSVTVSEYDSEGEYTTYSRTYTDTKNLYNYRQQVYGKGKFPREGVSVELEIPIPVDAPPSYVGRTINTNWAIKAVINRRFRSDFTFEKPVYILSRYISSERFQPISFPFDFGDVVASVVLPKQVLQTGEVVPGEIHIMAKNEVSFNEVRAALCFVENINVSGVYRPIDTRYIDGSTIGESAKQIVVKDVKLYPGQERMFPFQLQIPSALISSASTPFYEVQWALKVTLSRRLRKDFNLNVPVLLVNQIQSQI